LWLGRDHRLELSICLWQYSAVCGDRGADSDRVSAGGAHSLALDGALIDACEVRVVAARSYWARTTVRMLMVVGGIAAVC
jgi:hypothetical protein